MVQVEAVALRAVHQVRHQLARGVRKGRCDTADVNHAGFGEYLRNLRSGQVVDRERGTGGVAAVVLHPRLAGGKVVGVGRSATAFLDVQTGRAAGIGDDGRGVDTRSSQVRGEVAPETVVSDPGDDRCRNSQCGQSGGDVHFGAGRTTGEGR